MKKIFIFLVAMFNIVALNAQTIEDFKYWNNLMESIGWVESRHNPNAVSKSGKYVGYLQIGPTLVQEVNNILKSKKIDKQYSLHDRYNVQKSKEMFIIIQNKYNPNKSYRKAIDIWNCGLKGSASQAYYNKVMIKYDQISKI